MMHNKENLFTLLGVTYVAEDAPDGYACTDCALTGTGLCADAPSCFPIERTDNRWVIYKERQL